MVRIDDKERIFDVSRPHRTGPTPTSKPIIVGHHPIVNDPMMKEKEDEDDLFSSHIEKKVTPVHVTMHDNETEVNEASEGHETHNISSSEEPETEHTSDESTHEPHYKALTPIEEDSTHKEFDDTPSEPRYTSVESLMEEKHEPLPSTGHHSYGSEPPITALPLPHPKGAGPHSPFKKIVAWFFALLFLGAVGGYLAVDAGLVVANIKLPFDFIKDEARKPATVIPPPSTAPPPPVATTLPAGFTVYKLTGTNISFASPVEWGAPIVTADPGFSKRGGALKSDGTYATVVDFEKNKDVQMAVSSSKFLPPQRSALHYDFLQWCVGTNDAKIYKQLLRSTTTNGVDSPTTITCDQGPLTDASKLDENTIVQLKTKGLDGKDIGDLYTKNLADKALVVLRIKDAATIHAENIKKILATVQVDLKQLVLP
ncbi:hypothetical protein H0X09_01135 [Candidatus Saccharibacteria bacterium]|nr:hypothetical protein [Candidatus Saccharibacteria bacterium]